MSKVHLNMYQQDTIDKLVDECRQELLDEVTRLIDDKMLSLKARLNNELQDMSEFG